MNILDKVTASELDMFDTWRTDFCFDSANVANKMNAESLLKVWADRKERLFNLFGHELIISKHISFEKGKDQLNRDMDDAIFGFRSPAGRFINEWNEFCYNHLRNADTNDEYDMWSDLSGLTNIESLVSNVYGNVTHVLTGLDGTEIKVQRGCKVSKVLGKLAKGFNLAGYEEFRIAHSQALNQKKLVGDLTLSIHPLDYITMSDNECGWGSCMSWRDYGEYRRGTVEMMNSPCVVVAYLSAADPMKIGDFEWNSKKWRELFIVDEQLITEIKGYPYHNEHLVAEVLNWLKELVEKNWHYQYEDGIKTLFMNDDRCGYVCVGDEKIDVELYTDAMYNDFYYEHSAYIGKDVESISLGYSGPSQCMCCGRIDVCFTDSCDLACEYCDATVYCYVCNERINADDYRYEIDGETVCSYCYDDAHCCNVCGEPHLYGAEAGIKHNGRLYAESFWMCTGCRDEEVLCNVDNWHRNQRYWYEGPQIYVDYDDMIAETRERYVRQLFNNSINNIDALMDEYPSMVVREEPDAVSF